MPSLKELRNRIASVKSTQKITKAMQMVAAAKLRRAQSAAEAARPYATRMEAVLANLATALGGRRWSASDGGNGTGHRPSARGLHRRARALRRLQLLDRAACPRARRLISDGKQVKFLCVGKKGFDQLKRQFASQIIELIELRGVRQLGFTDAEAIAEKILGLFATGAFDVATLYFSRFRSVISQIPTALQIIPAVIPTEAPSAEAALGGAVYEYEPDEGEILTELLPLNIATQLLRALLENAASEQGARMSAMDNATRNAGDMIDRLTMKYNRSRQAMITKELIEIISGAEAL